MLPSNETEEITEGTLNEILTPDGVFLVIDPEHNKVWYVAGPLAPLPEQVWGKLLANEYRAQLKLFYKVVDANGINHNLFVKLLEKSPSGGKATEIKREVVTLESEPGEEEERPRLSMKDVVEVSRAREVCVHAGVIRQNALKRIKEVLNEEYTPPHLVSEFVLCESGIYVRQEEAGSFLKPQDVEEHLRRIGDLRDGFFFLPGRSSRLIAQRGRVLGLEFLAPKVLVRHLELKVPLPPEKRLSEPRDPSILVKAFHAPEDPVVVVEEDSPEQENSPN
ncbi:MAG: hypothetical protein Kow0069_23360 [Promethearchaeota archaeon]